VLWLCNDTDDIAGAVLVVFVTKSLLYVDVRFMYGGLESKEISESWMQAPIKKPSSALRHSHQDHGLASLAGVLAACEIWGRKNPL
jgi:hypothetical protein